MVGPVALLGKREAGAQELCPALANPAFRD